MWAAYRNRGCMSALEPQSFLQRGGRFSCLMLKRHTDQITDITKDDCRILAFVAVANHVICHPALLSHFPDERPLYRDPSRPLLFGWGFP
jgi:hypothetical protein